MIRLFPIRKAILKALISKAKTREELMKELKITEFQLRFNLNWLIKNGYVECTNDKFRITESGIEYLYK